MCHVDVWSWWHSRYDGYTVSAFRHSYNDTTSLSGNKTSTIYEDSEGRLWVGVLGAALNVSDISKSRFQRLKWPLEEKERLAIRITDITEDSLQRIWVATSSGLFVFRETEDGFLCDPFENVFTTLNGVQRIHHPTTLYTGEDGRIWIGSKEGLFVMDFTQEKLFHPTEMTGLPMVETYDVEPDRMGRIWSHLWTERPKTFYAPSKILFLRPSVEFLSWSVRRYTYGIWSWQQVMVTVLVIRPSGLISGFHIISAELGQ